MGWSEGHSSPVKKGCFSIMAFFSSSRDVNFTLYPLCFISIFLWKSPPYFQTQPPPSSCYPQYLLPISMPPPCPTVTLSPRSRASWSVITAWPGPHQKVRPKSSLLLPSIMAYFLKHGSTEIRNWSSMNENSSCNCKTSLPYFGVKLSVCLCLLIERKVMTYSYPKVT